MTMIVDDDVVVMDHRDASDNSDYWDDDEDDDADDDDENDEEEAVSICNSLIDDEEDDTTTDNSPISDDNKELAASAKTGGGLCRVGKWIIIAMILVFGSLVSAGIYWAIREEQRVHFEHNFFVHAHTVKDVTEVRMERLMDSYAFLSDHITTAGESSARGFPYAAVDLFEVLAGNARRETNTSACSFAPVVSRRDKANWTAYARNHQPAGWVQLEEESGRSRLGGDEPEQMYHFPLWQMSPPPGPHEDDSPRMIGYELLSEDYFAPMFRSIEAVQGPIFSRMLNASAIHWATTKTAMDDSSSGHYYGDRYAILMHPVFARSNNRSSPIVGLLQTIAPMDPSVTGLVSKDLRGLYYVIENTCGQVHTYTINGDKTIHLGEGDLHEDAYSHMGLTIRISPSLGGSPSGDDDDKNNVAASAASRHQGHCAYAARVYPSAVFERNSHSAHYLQIEGVMAITAIAFVSVAIFFLVNDMFLQRQARKVAEAAYRSNRVVSSLFPATVRERLLRADSLVDDDNTTNNNNQQNGKEEEEPRLDTTTTSEEEEKHNALLRCKPIADLFPSTSILFADIPGFTAWSSMRQPAQVFELLETLFAAFDKVAKKRHVFKIETIGDCYVAVAGLPHQRDDHAILMCKFAHSIARRMDTLTRTLEESLGPDTGDLNLRIGIHSGQVVAGVLRGNRSRYNRYQVFGDTMNTASRMESTGVGGRIQLSQETANLLCAAGKSHWVKQREEKVHAKGKGELQTYWLKGTSASGSDGEVSDWSELSDDSSDDDDDDDDDDDELVKSLLTGRQTRLIKYTADVLLRYLKHVVECRDSSGQEDTPAEPHHSSVDQVHEILALPRYNEAAEPDHNPELIELSSDIEDQLRDFVTTISLMYRDNPFHNFERACHGVMQVVKFLSRTVSAQAGENSSSDCGGVSWHPLAKFALVFAALVQHVDHAGVPNEVLVKEKSRLAKQYGGRSVGEQHSFNVAWDLLMEKRYKRFRGAIFASDIERRHFRQLVVNLVMATDVADADLLVARTSRWHNAFTEPPSSARSFNKRKSQKAAVLMEQLIQACDVAHTMQHWQVYCKWSERCFMEKHKAFKGGRCDDPGDSWYEAELEKFDTYIVPLAKKLEQCGIFGESGNEYLDYATRNRNQWEKNGPELVAGMLQQIGPSSKTQRIPKPNAAYACPKSEPSVPSIFDIVSRLEAKALDVEQMDSSMHVNRANGGNSLLETRLQSVHVVSDRNNGMKTDVVEEKVSLHIDSPAPPSHTIANLQSTRGSDNALRTCFEVVEEFCGSEGDYKDDDSSSERDYDSSTSEGDCKHDDSSSSECDYDSSASEIDSSACESDASNDSSSPEVDDEFDVGVTVTAVFSSGAEYSEHSVTVFNSCDASNHNDCENVWNGDGCYSKARADQGDIRLIHPEP